MVYIATADGGFCYGDPGNLDAMKTMDISPLSDVMESQKYGDQIWICDRNGIGVLEGSSFHYMDDLPMNNSVNHVMTDMEPDHGKRVDSIHPAYDKNQSADNSGGKDN